MIVEYINRYEDVIIFEEVSGNIKMTFTEDSGLFIRLGWKSDSYKENGKYNMIDGSGGPYITEGTNMGLFHKDWDGKIVKSIIGKPNSNKEYLLLIKK
jgi:hypothetical protein